MNFVGGGLLESLMQTSKAEWLEMAEHWFDYPGGDEAMWRCLLRWASGIEF